LNFLRLLLLSGGFIEVFLKSVGFSSQIFHLGASVRQLGPRLIQAHGKLVQYFLRHLLFVVVS
jgi:hypothetical protein